MSNRKIALSMLSMICAAGLVSNGVVQAQSAPVPATATAGAAVADKDPAAITAVPELIVLAEASAEKKDWDRYGKIMQRIAQLRPYAGNIQLEIAASHALRNDKTGGYNALMPLPGQGYGFAIEDDERLENLHGTQVWDYLVEKFADNRKPVGGGRVFATLPRQDLLIESVAWDPTRKALLVGSVRTGKVSRVEASGKLVDFIVPDKANAIGGVFDLAVDAKRKLLWVATAQVPHAGHSDPARYGEAALLKFDLSTGKLLKRLDIPSEGSPHLPSGMSVGPDGALFVADTVQPVIWKVEADVIRPVVRNPNLTGIRAITLNDKGTVLYIADHELGVFGLELASGSAFLLAGPPQLTLFAVDALAWHGDKLIAVQNGFPPARVMRFALDEAGRKITNAQVLDAGHAAFGVPGTGAVGDDAYYLIANSQKGLVDGSGKLVDAKSLQGVRIFRTDLNVSMPEAPELPASLRGLPSPGQ